MDLSDRVAVVTGASAGIGAAFARELARRGAAVALVARREDRLRALAGEIEAAGGQASVHRCDVSEPGDVRAAAADVVARWGRVDLLLNNAGAAHHGLFKDLPVARAEALVRTNLLGPIYWTKELLPVLRGQDRAWLVNVSSFAGLLGQPDEAVYSAAKFGVAGLSQALRAELEPLGIHVLCVYPVLVESEMFSDEVMARMPAATHRRFVSAEKLVDETLRALARGQAELVVPRAYRGVVLLRTLFPRLMDRIIARTKLAPLRDLET